MRLSYRSKLMLKRFLKIALILAAVALVAAIIVLIYVEPFVVYDREGAHLELNPSTEPTVELREPETRPVVDNPQIIYSVGETTGKTIAELGGYYITTSMLLEPQTVLETVKSLDEPCAVMIQLKSIWGYYYYSTGIGGAERASIDTGVVDELLTYLKSNGFYMIAEIPAFSDMVFALNNQSCGLPISGGALWMDENGTYWLDPADENVLAYLMQIARELAGLGFREVAFSNFTFPSSENIVYSSDKTHAELVADAAAQLSGFFTGSSTVISFVSDATDFPAASCNGRLYIPNVDGSRVEMYAQAYKDADTLLELVFKASSRDTRFENRAILRPLIAE